MHERYCQAYVLYGTVTTVCPQAVCPQLLFALNYCSPQLCLRYDYDYDDDYEYGYERAESESESELCVTTICPQAVCPQDVCPQPLFARNCWSLNCCLPSSCLPSTTVLLNYAYAMTMTMTMTMTTTGPTVGSRSMKALALDSSSSRWRGISGSDPYKDLSVGQLLDYTRSLYQQMDVPGFAFQPAGQGGRSSLPVWQWGVCWLWLPAPRSRSKKSPINLKQF